MLKADVASDGGWTGYAFRASGIRTIDAKVLCHWRTCQGRVPGRTGYAISL